MPPASFIKATYSRYESSTGANMAGVFTALLFCFIYAELVVCTVLVIGYGFLGFFGKMFLFTDSFPRVWLSGSRQACR